MGYRQLTQVQRYQIFAYLETGISQRQIIKAIGVHSSTISREIKRNGLTSGYAPQQAQSRSDQRRRTAWKVTKRLPSLVRWVTSQLMDEWSPQQISGFMANANGVCVSHQLIYALIWDDKKRGGTLWKRLRLPRQRRYQRQLAKRAGLGKIPHHVGIEKRPAKVEERRHIGHWEGDTVLKGHKESGLVTLVERHSGYFLAARLPTITATRTAQAMTRLLAPRRGAVHTITLDNGSEFAEHRKVAKAISAKTYFCDPYRSCRRGTNENTNDLIRQYFPKGTDFRKVTNAELWRVVNKLNDRPRKRLGYRTPAQVLLSEYSGALEPQVLHSFVEFRHTIGTAMTYTDLFENDDMKLINLLPQDGAAYYHGKILDTATAARYLDKCISELSWEHDRAFIYGKEIVTKRKIAWYADEPVSYTYSGYTKIALVWPDFLREIKQQVESHCGEVFNSCLGNFYSSGEEGMSWHSDAEKDLVEHGAIGALSLGGARKFSFKHKHTGESVSVNLEHGSLLIMKGTTQQNWLHSLPKTKKGIEPRVSLTFRQMR